MHEMIVTLAQNISGARETEVSLLELLCTAQEQAWTDRLNSGTAPENCRETFCCACAFSAAADLLASRAAEGVASFRAGDVSVQRTSGTDDRAVSASLRSQAERLMAPYVESDDFCFRGVRA